MNSFLTEYDEEKTMAAIGQERYADGVEDGKKVGIQTGIQTGIRAFILDKLEDDRTEDEIISKLVKSFDLTPEAAKFTEQEVPTENKEDW